MIDDIPEKFKKNNCYLNNTKLKRGKVSLQYTKEQIEEILKCRQDVVYFAKNYVKIISLDKGLVLFDAYDYQQEMLKTCKDNRFSVFLCARQLGKCIGANTLLNIRNKKTGEILEISIGDFYKMHESTL